MFDINICRSAKDYIFHVLVKEIIIFLIMDTTGIAYEMADDRCRSTEESITDIVSNNTKKTGQLCERYTHSQLGSDHKSGVNIPHQIDIRSTCTCIYDIYEGRSKNM